MNATFSGIYSILIAILSIDTKICSSLEINDNPIVCCKTKKWKNINNIYIFIILEVIKLFNLNEQ